MLITLEGIDGAGKTTVLEALSDSHPEACTTREPTTSWYGDAVDRSISSPDSDSLAELFLFIADHADHLSRVVEPALDAGELVISDRYVDSRIAYQGAALNGEVPRPMEYIRGIHTAFTRMPDATIYYDIDPETGAERAGATNKLEHADFLADVHENYERLIDRDPQRFHRIDATRSPEAVIDATEDVLESLL
ncbi:dTMP kinase [Halosegnis rubeus]|uniref:Probable thymidylate kinase n=1 Tax=Halosegnis rubeus TaxID=2212850 RepID=A0A5N5UAX1_9EURY|nr:dTMP kinase [Halosegnis rubeus]KAB7515763.1 dTMP kinase [Halosegnis rubeus]KAB7517022.1 dTMP kinase [Halosegnis rubeus]KAB7519850.1 dTMP kinase [Halosegnis rubeus]